LDLQLDCCDATTAHSNVYSNLNLYCRSFLDAFRTESSVQEAPYARGLRAILKINIFSKRGARVQNLGEAFRKRRK